MLHTEAALAIVAAVGRLVPMRCWLCGEDVSELTDEHIVPRRWGGRLKAQSCKSCNRLAEALERGAEEVTWLASAIGRARVRGRGGRVREIETEVQLPDGGTAIAAHTTDGLIPRTVRPRRLGVDADGKELWEVPEEQRDTFLARAVKRGKKVEIVGSRRATYEGGETGFGIGPANLLLWPRLAAKFALGCAQHVDDHSWIDSPAAQRLQRLLVHERWRGPDLQPLPGELEEGDRLVGLMAPDEHLLSFQLSPNAGGSFVFVLFGRIAYALPLPELDLDRTKTWLLRANQPAERHPRALDEIVASLMLREIRARGETAER